MTLAMHTNGLQHAISLGHIEAASKETDDLIQFEKSYDSDDENMGRHRFRTSSSSELYTRTSVYSKGDIREQYCLTDRQLNTIERPRRERLFGCLPRGSSPQSFLGVCVGRRAPSDENLAAYAPFYKYPRYRHHYAQDDDKPLETDLESSYFRRQPASILSTAKINTDSGARVGVAVGNRHSWTETQASRTEIENPMRSQDQRLGCHLLPVGMHYEDLCTLNPSNSGPYLSTQPSMCLFSYGAHTSLPRPAPGTSTLRTKHVSFARSHTLTSFDDVSLGLRSSGRLKTLNNDERLIGGKKPPMSLAAATNYETIQVLPPLETAPLGQQLITADGTQQLPPASQQHPIALHHPHVIHGHQHAHSHSHNHMHQLHHGPPALPPPPLHVHQLVPICHREIDTQLGSRHEMAGMENIMAMEMTGIGGIHCYPATAIAPHPSSPEIVVVEKKFRNAMKTQATQTELRKERIMHNIELSPTLVHKVKVVSQGAQTNGLQNGKKLAKSLSEMIGGNTVKSKELAPTADQSGQKSLLKEHEILQRTHSEEPPRSPKHSPLEIGGEKLLLHTMFYKPPPAPPDLMNHPQTRQLLVRRSSRISSIDSNQSQQIYDYKMPLNSSSQSVTTRSDNNYEDFNQTFDSYEEAFANLDSHIISPFDYESNSLPRRTCSYHRLDNILYSNSLPRKDPVHSHDFCRHITDCTELLRESNNTSEYSKQHLLPPPRQYRKREEEEEAVVGEEEEETLGITNINLIDKQNAVNSNRRVSMVAISGANPFKRDDIRRQSLPAASRTEKTVVARKSLEMIESSEEKEIFIDFKPHTSPIVTTKRHQMQRNRAQRNHDGSHHEAAQGRLTTQDHHHYRVLVEDECNVIDQARTFEENVVGTVECDDEEEEVEDDRDDEEKEEEEDEEPLYENVQCYNLRMPCVEGAETSFRKRSISLEDAGTTKAETTLAKSDPPSPCPDELLVNASTYPSSDSLANDLTRDHSDGIWNESQVTVLTADNCKDQNDRDQHEQGQLSKLLTPASKRKHLILQHQQRSSIDTEALDLEDQLADQSPTYSNLLTKTTSAQTTNALQQKSRELSGALLAVSTTIVPPTIAVTPTGETMNIQQLRSPQKVTPDGSRRSSKSSLSPVMPDVAKIEQALQELQQKNIESQTICANYTVFRVEASKTNNTDVSECSTNTDEYLTCTDNSKRTPGIKTPLTTTTSSSSTTQVPVSAQSSQTEKTHGGGSSFESASSLYSTRGEVIFDELPTRLDETLAKIKTPESIERMTLRSPCTVSITSDRRSPSHSVSSTSSGSYNPAGRASSPSQSKCGAALTAATAITLEMASTPSTAMSALDRSSSGKSENRAIKTESISDDERSDIRYSSSGYYESPHDDEEQSPLSKASARRPRAEDERKRKRSSMRNLLDVEKENFRATTSPTKKSEIITSSGHKEKTCIKPTTTDTTTNCDAATSPSKIKRFRPKIRRQFRKVSRDESTVRRPKNTLTAPPAKPLDELVSMESGRLPSALETSVESRSSLHDRATPTATVNNFESRLRRNNATLNAEDVFQLKAKSVESLRSVSPGSDSVFYSEADGTGGDQHSHCLHCGKEMEPNASNASNVVAAPNDSIESLPAIESDLEHDIVRPPSDFADSPVTTTKTTQRLYKKMDKRFRSEERYHTERGRHFRNRSDNMRAKSEERGREKGSRSPLALRPTGSSPCVLPNGDVGQRHQVIYRGSYDCGRYCRLTDADVWTQLDHQSFDRQRDRRSSTESERSFYTKYQVILHRLVQRRCTLEMYHRQKNNTFRIDKTVVVKSDSGEFGFRIHGSKPVVVAAIEPDTPAESSGLEVGDIIISVNGVQVLDKHHTEVVKIAHAGCDTLALEVARTIGVLMHEQQELPAQPIFSGYLWRQSGQARGTPNTKKWVRRWFCLRPDHCLYYYKTEEDTQPVGAMIMAKHKVESCPQPDTVGKPFAFKIDAGEGIPMFVAADSEELANQWMAILKHSAVQTDPWLEKCARTLHQPPSGILRPDCFGYLMKLGSRWCGWSKRYCVLKDACLYFYQDANSKNAFGMACLQGYKVASMSTNASGRKNSFEIIPQEPKLRHYYFSTDSEMDKKRWISALEYSIDRWIKSG